MKVVRFGLLVATLLVLGSRGADAQMVVSPNVGERVDYPFFSDGGPRVHVRYRHHHRRHTAWHHHSRFVILESQVPAPQPFGWANCCL